MKSVDLWDNGTYECRAEVASHGNVKLRLVHLEVLCTSLSLLVICTAVYKVECICVCVSE